MYSSQSNPILTLVNVGHGSAAVLHYAGLFTIFDTGNKGQHLLRYLKKNKISTIQTIIISHSDSDHSGGLISILLDQSIHVKNLFINADPTKKTNSYDQLKYAIHEARLKRNTIIETSVNTSLTGRLDIKDLRVEILFPPPEDTFSGVGSKNLRGRSLTSNSMCAAIRLVYKNTPNVLLGGDIDFSYLIYCENENINSSAEILVFPHHGGSVGSSYGKDLASFATKMAELVNPKYIIFSIHKTKYSFPRQEILDALLTKTPDICFLCTQLPDKFSEIAISTNPGPWKMHRLESGGVKKHIEGDIKVVFSPEECSLNFDI